MPEPNFKTYTIKSVIPSPFVSFWRHPVWWWKMRHLRADLRHEEKKIAADPARAALVAEFNERLEHELLFGQGTARLDD